MPKRSGRNDGRGDQKPAQERLSQRASALICGTIQRFLDSPATIGAVDQSFESHVPLEIREFIKLVLDPHRGVGKSYPIVLICQLAVGIESREFIDLTKRAPGMRGQQGTAGIVGKYLKERHIPCVPDAYQNIGKNDDNLIRGNVQAFDHALKWASARGRTKGDLIAVLNYCCLEFAKRARPVLPMPPLDPARLTFASVMLLLDSLLEVPSRGAYQQFITACLLHAREAQLNSGRRVETKHIHSSDESAGSPADIQVKLGTRVEEAYEVTGNEWIEKIHSVDQKIRAHDLSRLHIVASVQDRSQMLEQLATLKDDISVLELRGYFAVLVSELRRTGRAAALNRLYELLDRLQSDTELVNEYVRALTSRGLTSADAT